MPAAAPRMTPPNALYRQPASGQRAVAAQGVKRVFRTARREAAPPQRPEQDRLRRRNHPAINAHAENQDVLSHVHAFRSPTGFNNLAFRSVVKKSRSTWANPFPAMDGHPTSTRSTGPANSCWCRRNDSRMSRRARLRTTAPPIRPLVITPRRDAALTGNRCQFAIRQPRTSRSPARRTRAKSRPCLMRAARPNGQRCGVLATMRRPAIRALNACDRPGGDWPKCRARSCSSCGPESRAAVSAGPSMVDIVVSYISSVCNPPGRIPMTAVSGNTPLTERESITATPPMSSGRNRRNRLKCWIASGTGKLTNPSLSHWGRQ